MADSQTTETLDDLADRVRSDLGGAGSLVEAAGLACQAVVSEIGAVAAAVFDDHGPVTVRPRQTPPSLIVPWERNRIWRKAAAARDD